jgi:hypothetical protein
MYMSNIIILLGLPFVILGYFIWLSPHEHECISILFETIFMPKNMGIQLNTHDTMSARP